MQAAGEKRASLVAGFKKVGRRSILSAEMGVGSGLIGPRLGPWLTRIILAILTRETKTRLPRIMLISCAVLAGVWPGLHSEELARAQHTHITNDNLRRLNGLAEYC